MLHFQQRVSCANPSDISVQLVRPPLRSRGDGHFLGEFSATFCAWIAPSPWVELMLPARCLGEICVEIIFLYNFMRCLYPLQLRCLKNRTEDSRGISPLLMKF